MNSHNRAGGTGNRHLPERHRVHARRAVGTQDDKGLVGITQSADPMQQNETKTEVIKSDPSRSFADLSLKVVAVRTADDSDFGFEFPASGPQTTPSTLTSPLEQRAEHRRDLLPEFHTWRHGGINE